jgi:hypothetical protein
MPAEEGLQRHGAQLPLTSLEDDIKVTRNLLSMQKGPTVLVGHSYDGFSFAVHANSDGVGSSICALLVESSLSAWRPHVPAE